MARQLLRSTRIRNRKIISCLSHSLDINIKLLSRRKKTNSLKIDHNINGHYTLSCFNLPAIKSVSLNHCNDFICTLKIIHIKRLIPTKLMMLILSFVYQNIKYINCLTENWFLSRNEFFKVQKKHVRLSCFCFVLHCFTGGCLNLEHIFIVNLTFLNLDP